MACVRSGISGWVIGLLIRGRAGAERRAANSWSPVLADSEARRCFLFGTWRSAVAELFANSRCATAGRRAAFGCARTVLDFGIGRARPLLESARQGVRVNCLLVAALARARAAPRPAVSIGGSGAQLWGLFGASRSKTLAEGWLWRVCALAFPAG